MKKSNIKSLILLFVCGFIFTLCACEKNRAEIPEDIGKLTAFSYEFGSFHGGYYDYIIQRKDGDLYLEGEGTNGADLDVHMKVDDQTLDDIVAILNKTDVYSWNGFDKRDNSILDGYSFSLSGTFERGDLSASGYEKYPQNYDAFHKALTGYLDELIKNAPPVANENGTPIFEFINDEMVKDFAENYESNPPVSVTVRYDTVGDGTPDTHTDKETIDAVYKAISTMTVGKSLGSGHTDDYLNYTFKMADNTSITFEFQEGALLMPGMELYEVTNFDALYKALPPL